MKIGVQQIDYNTANPEPFIKASKDILGEDNIYYMLALGTMQESEAFRNLCRAYNLNMEQYNEVAKDLKLYESDPKWAKIIEESKKYIGVIDSVSPSPCAFLLLQDPIPKEIGIIKVNNQLCACIDGLTADKWGYLKNDFLTVSVWGIIAKTFEKIKQPIPSIEELKPKLDDKVWNLYRDGITATLNQVDSDFATGLMKKYCAKSVAELTAFVAAIRPSFASLLDKFLNREKHSTGVIEVDEILEDSFHYILYQESIMKFLTWCGIPEDSTYSIIKKISKKVFDEEELQELKTTLYNNFSKKVSNPEKFDDIWKVIEDAVRYSFNSAHALSVAWDSLYGAYLKANYPFEYYTTVLDHYIENTKKTSRIISELEYFNIGIEDIKFRNSIDKYTFDKKTSKIYKGIESIKYCNSKIALELYELRNNKYETFIDLLVDIQQTTINSRQLNILTILNFFSEFGLNGTLLEIIRLFKAVFDRKQIKKDNIEKLGLKEWNVKAHAGKETEKIYKDLDTRSILINACKTIDSLQVPIDEQLNFEMEYLEYLVTIAPEMVGYYFVKSFIVYGNKNRPYVTLYDISNGKEIQCKVTDDKQYLRAIFEQGDIIKVITLKTKNKKKRVNGKWRESEEKENILSEWEIIKYNCTK